MGPFLTEYGTVSYQQEYTRVFCCIIFEIQQNTYFFKYEGYKRNTITKYIGRNRTYSTTRESFEYIRIHLYSDTRLQYAQYRSIHIPIRIHQRPPEYTKYVPEYTEYVFEYIPTWRVLSEAAQCRAPMGSTHGRSLRASQHMQPIARRKVASTRGNNVRAPPALERMPLPPDDDSDEHADASGGDSRKSN